MRILIADDEQLVRFSLRNMLEEMGTPARSVLSVCDGQEMVELVRRVKPEVGFVDIRMPRLDGLAAIEAARASSPATRWVILTSHSSFDYARRALQLGVSDYLLKPVSPEELRKVLDKVSTEVRQELARQNDEFRGRVSSLLHGTLSLEAEEVEFVSTARFAGCLIVFDSALPEDRLAERQRAVLSDLRSRIAGAAERTARLALVTLPVGYAALVCAWQPGPEEPMAAEAMHGFLHTAQTVLDGGARPDARVTLIATGTCHSFDELLSRLNRASAAAPLRIPLGIGRRIDLEEAEREQAAGHWADLCAGLTGVALAVRARSRLDFLAGLETAERALEAPSTPAAERERAAVRKFTEAAVGLPPEAEPGSAEWKDRMRAAAEALGPEERAAGELVRQVREFVHGAYMRDIGIGQIAFHLGVTPNYLSSLFHRETGTTFVRFLTGLRMDHARELLAAPGARVQDVARSVGYASVRHFSRLFQRQFGAHPSDVKAEKNARES
ncbi:MAG TPA: response regulator [Spirochaetia bacterium]|nr:response regulator [Spirochaetia bacterium]